MTSSLTESDPATLIESLNNKDSEILNDALQSLIMTCQNNKGKEIVPFFQSLFQKLDKLLSDENLSVIVQTCQLVLEIVNNFPKESEPYCHYVCGKLVLNLGDSKPVIRKMALNSLTGIIKQTKNYDLVFYNLTKYGVEHANPQIRHRAMLNITTIVATDPNCIQSSNEFKILIEKILDKVGNDTETVQSTATYIVQQLKSTYPDFFTSLNKKLSSKYNEKLRRALNQGEPTITETKEVKYEPPLQTLATPKQKNIPENTFNTSTPPRSKSELLPLESPARNNPVKFPTPTKEYTPTKEKEIKKEEDKVFGLFSKSVMDNITSSDWKERSQASEEILGTLEKCESGDKLIPYLEDFVKLMLKLLNDMNFKISINALNIVGLFIKLMSEENLKPYIESLINGLMEKLGDSKIATRQIASQILVVSSKKIELEDFIKIVLPYLKESNWHLREESLALIIAVLKVHPTKLTHEFYQETIENILELLDDQKPKVRQTARETIIAILVHSTEPYMILDEIKEFLEKDLYEYICQRIENPNMSVEGLSRNPSFIQKDHRSFGSLGGIDMSYSQISEKPTRNVSLNSTESFGPQNIPGYTSANNTTTSSPFKNTATNSLLSSSPYRKSTFGDNLGLSQTSTISSNLGINDNGDHSNAHLYDLSHNDILRQAREQMASRVSSKQSSYTSNSVSPYLKKGVDVSTASSSRSGLSRQAGNVYSFESSLISTYSGADKAKLPKYNNRYSDVNERTQSAQVQQDLKLSQPYDEKRTFSAVEKPANDPYLGFQNRLSQKLQNPNQEVYLEFSIAKDLGEFGTHNLETQPSGSTLDYQEGFYTHKKPPLPTDFNKVHNFSTPDDKKKNSQNPYRSGKPELTQRLKKLQAHSQSTLENSDTLTAKSGSDSFRTQESPLKTKSFCANEQIHEREEAAEDENDNADNKNFSFKINSNPKFAKRKIIKAPTLAETGTTNIDYKKQGYLTKEELQPIEGNLEQALKTMIQDLKNDDWQKQFNGLDTLRSFLQFHTQTLLNSPNFNLHNIVSDILKAVESLRSNVAKNALITLNEMSQVLKKQLDAEADTVLLRLIKKGNDSNNFIADEVKKTITAIAQNCSDIKMIPCLASLTNHKAIPAKINICLCLEAIIQRNEGKVNQLRDFDRLVIMLGNYLLDGAQEVRNVAKRATTQLIKQSFSRGEIERVFQRSFNEINYGKLLSILDKELGQATTSPLTITHTQIKTRSTSKAKPNKSINEDEKLEIETDSHPTKEAPLTCPAKGKKFTYTREPADFDNLPTLFMLAENNDWKTRHEAVQSLTEFAKKNSEALLKSKQQLKFYDCYIKLLLDSNIKVSSLAINCFTELVPKLKTSIEGNINNIMNAVFSIMGSVNSTIKVAGDSLFQALVKHVDLVYLIPAWTNILPFTNPKAKALVLNKLNEMIPEIYEKKQLLVTKNIIPAAAKCIEDTKADIKMATNKLFQSLYGLMGKSILEHVPGNKAQIILDIVS